jgi:hypothetical protein
VAVSDWDEDAILTTNRRYWRTRRRWIRRLLLGPWLILQVACLAIIWAPIPFPVPAWVDTWRTPLGVILAVIVLGVALYDTFFVPDRGG